MTGRPPAAPLAAAARGAARLGVLGGSFDPPHLGHLHAARRARAAFALQHVVFVPAARPPHKPERRLASAEQRLAMLALLLADEPDASIWSTELERGGPSYTVDTLRELRALAPGARLFLVLGEDNLPGFARWREAEEIVRLAQPIVVHRRGSADAPAELAPLSRAAQARVRLGRLSGAPFDASSSAMRSALAGAAETQAGAAETQAGAAETQAGAAETQAGATETPAGEVLPAALARYVRAHGLYRGP